VIAQSVDEARSRIEKLVENFERGFKEYKNPKYNEESVRVQFINPMFEALGWDVRNEQGFSEMYKDVIHEDAIKIGGATKAPDYCFRIGGNRKFFLEAKKPAVPLKEAAAPAYQLRRYAWSAKLPLSILTDFEEFCVYDCRIRPKDKDKVSVGRVNYLTFNEYLDRFDEIYGIFSKESVLKGSFDRFVEDKKKKKGTAEVDNEFLKEIESWRDLLARNIALRNKALDVSELNFAVQRTIDRIIFLRMCEDRGIETYGRLQGLTNGEKIYDRLCEIFYRADDKYNSSIFDFKADTLCPKLKIDNKVLKTILSNLYYPKSPYEFSVIPPEVLGQVYEQFLGKVIRLTRGHQARVEEKPEVRKAGGVYYTPKYIVDYIVKQTVGKLTEDKTPRQISKLRILDPACGSGSFLLGAYQYLLDYHLNWYRGHNPSQYSKPKGKGKKRKPPAVFKDKRKEWRLTTEEKKRILLNNIYGVDIDRQAVEVTKLSLLLKVLQDEDMESLGTHQLLFLQARILPNLGDNIKCGNSLIGPDYFTDQVLPDTESLHRINPFDWKGKEGFPEIMNDGGFDAVIGNPPYDVISAREQNRDKKAIISEKNYYKSKTHLSQALGNKLNYYRLFIAQSFSLLRVDGYHGFIVPMGLLADLYARSLRHEIIRKTHLLYVEVFPQKDDPNNRIFKYAKLPTCIYILQKPIRYSEDTEFSLRVHAGKDIDENTPLVRLSPKKLFSFSVDQLTIPVKQLCTTEEISLASKLGTQSVPLSYYANSKQGEINVTTHKKYLEWRAQRDKEVASEFTEVFRGAHIGRYLIHPPKQGGYYYLNKAYFLGEKKGKQTKAYDHKNPRIGYQRGAALDNWRRIVATIIPEGIFFADTINYIVPPQNVSIRYLLAVLNSTLLEWRFRLTSATNHVNSYEIDLNNEKDRNRHDKLAYLVEQIININMRLPMVNTDDDKTMYLRQIDAMEQEIDNLVYELYGMTEEEIKVVENNDGQ